MADAFSRYYAHLSDPAENAAAVTPNDTTDLPNFSRYIYVGGAGNLQVTLVGGTTVTYTGLTAGSRHPLRVSRVHSTGTTATSIVAEW